MAGIDATGLTIKRQPEILSDIVLAQKTNIDSNFNADDNTVIGQQNKELATVVASLWALAQAVNDNFNIDLAEGKNLDDLAALRNVTRQGATSSTTAYYMLTGTNGTVVPAGTYFSNPSTGDQFTNPTAITISSSACTQAKIKVSTLLNNTNYVVTVDGTDYTYLSDASATKIEIADGIAALITAVSGLTAVSDGVDSVTITNDDDTTAISVSVITYFLFTSVTSFGRLDAVETGVIAAPAGSVSSIDTAVSGLSSATNPYAFIVGREEETDDELRVRIAAGGDTSGTGTVPSIEASILNNVAGVTSVEVVENVSDVTDGSGRPPHSFETVVIGGTDVDVATELWRVKPAGIQLYGGQFENITDSGGQIRRVDFTRPSAITIEFIVNITQYAEEPPLTGDYADKIKQAIVDKIATLGVGVDVIAGRFFGSIYGAVDGIDTVEVLIAYSPTTPTVSTTLAISDSEYATASVSNIDVNIV